MRLNQSRQRARLKQRHVRIQQQHCAFFALEERFGLQQRVSGAQLGRLDHKLEVRSSLKGRPHFVAAVANNQHGRGHVELIDRPQNVFDQRPAGQRMQHLGQRRLHARAFAGGEDNNVEIVGSAHKRLKDYRPLASTGCAPSSGASWRALG